MGTETKSPQDAGRVVPKNTMTKRTLTVTTEYGTFTRTTARDYQYIVLVHPDVNPAWAWGWSSRLDLAQKASADYRRLFPSTPITMTIHRVSDGATVA